MANTVEAPSTETPEAKRSTHRSPNFPGLTLSDAIEKVRTIFANDKRNPTTPTVILSHLGYGKTISGSAGRVLSALRQYGLLEEVGDKLKVSDGAFLILTLSEKATERLDAVRKAAYKPALFREVLKEYKDGLPSDATLRDWLIAQKGFNPASVDGFIRSFKATLQFANIVPGVYTEPADGGQDGAGELSVGDFAQWESQGALQFDAPRRVTYVSPDRMFALVEGSATGIPMEQLTKVDPPSPPVHTILGSHIPSQAQMPTAKPADGFLALTVPYGAASINVQVRTVGVAITAAHIARVRRYLELAEEDLRADVTPGERDDKGQ